MPDRPKLKHYVVRKGRGYWLATVSMQALGFPSSVRCGPDGPDAWRVAHEWEERWQRVRLNREPPPKHVWPAGSLGEAWERYRRSATWADKKPRTREDWERGWRYIEPIFGDVAPRTVTFEHVDVWYAGLKATAGIREAHRAVKIWRALWQVAAALLYCGADADPTFGVRRTTPKERTATWRKGEVARLVKGAWRLGYHGLACIIAIAYDAGLAPVDARSLTFADSRQDGNRDWFEMARTKTGRAGVATLTKATERLVRAYLKELPADQVAAAPIFRTRTGAAYKKNSLGKDFRDVRAAIFPGEKRQLQDTRRTAASEAVAGDVSPGALASKMANTIDASKALQKTYVPVDHAAVGNADEARRRGRRRLLENNSGRKVETLQPGELKPAKSGASK
jgi:hypothetical protein